MVHEAEDSELLLRVAAKDAAAFADFCKRHAQAIYRLAYRTLGDASAAEDAAAAIFAKVWFKARAFRVESRAATWLYRLAVRTILDAARARNRWWRKLWRVWRDRGAAAAGGSNDPAQALDCLEQQDNAARRVHAALAQLKEPDRALVHLFYFEELGLPEIEAILKVPQSVLKMRLHRARAKLRQLLGE